MGITIRIHTRILGRCIRLGRTEASEKAMYCIEESNDYGLNMFYPGFEQVVPPSRTAALRAWKGSITPFPDSSDLGSILEDLERQAIVDIDIGGALRHSEECRFKHTAPLYLPRLGKMSVTFNLIVLEFAGKRHRQAYCLTPLISSRLFPSHPHLRRDQVLWTDAPVDAICPYRSDETRPSGLLQYLDFVSIFLAKRLVWVRTLSLKCYSEFAAAKTLYTPTPNTAHFTVPVDWARSPFAPWSQSPLGYCELVSAAADESHADRWEGIWMGPDAPHDPATLAETVSRDSECTCGGGRRYGSCCRPIHLALSNGVGISPF